MKANLIASRYECPRCKKEMRLQERNGTVNCYEWRCRSQSKDNPHEVVRIVRKGTWFSESKLAITIILRLTRYWFGKSMNAFVVNGDLTVTSWWMTIFMNSLHPSQGCIHQRNITKCKRKKNGLVNVALCHIHHIWHSRERLRESGQPIGRLRKTCKNAVPRTIPISFGRVDTSIATESILNVPFVICTLVVIHATLGLLETYHVAFNHDQVTRSTHELAPPSPNYDTTPTAGRLSSRQI
ncbi:uncharacterized protein TNCV_2633791 [Trichonephila clavipes]|nr:uncharacterized protein TNCV_2633791 [Trichonephila clavipes]